MPSQCVSAECSWGVGCALVTGWAEKKTEFLLDSERLRRPVTGSEARWVVKTKLRGRQVVKDLYCYHTQLGESLNRVESFKSKSWVLWVVEGGLASTRTGQTGLQKAHKHRHTYAQAHRCPQAYLKIVMRGLSTGEYWRTEACGRGHRTVRNSAAGRQSPADNTPPSSVEEHRPQVAEKQV